MSSGLEALASRKEALVSRGRLQRSQVQLLVARISDGARVPRLAASVLASPQGRKLVLGAVLLVFRGGRVGRVVRIALGAVALLRIARGARPG